MPANKGEKSLKVDRYRLLGCPCLAIDSIGRAREVLFGLVSSASGGYSVAINAEKMMFYRRDPEFREVIEHASIPFSDGAGAVLALRFLHGKKSIKLDLPRTALDLAGANKWRLFVLGSREEVNKIACERITELYPGIQLVGRLNGFENEETTIESFEKSSPQLALVGMGSPKQEFLFYRMRSRFPHLFMIGCGGALDILAGRSKRAPAFMVENNLEWLYRLYKQPSRWRRQLKLAVFVLYMLTEKAGLLARPSPRKGSSSSH